MIASAGLSVGGLLALVSEFSYKVVRVPVYVRFEHVSSADMAFSYRKNDKSSR